jgi:3-hydroxybutyryl-CoA dehydrogenase/3-hydroxyacyl-CoA dehydrogenase
MSNDAKTVGVLGAGVMGSGIAQVTAIAGFRTVCYDVDADALTRAHEHVTTGRFGLDSAVERGKLARDDADAALARLSFTGTFDEAANTDVVIEAVPERLELKVRVFRDLDRIAPASTILASNTSGFPIAALAAATDRPEQVIGWHWASPAPVMKLAEIVRTASTSEETIATVSDMAARCGKNPIVVNDTPTSWGFVANRVYFAMIREANRVVEEGVATREQVDQLMTDCFRWPAGPFGMVRGATGGWS